MKKSRQNEAECRERREEGKKAYQPPKLTALGTVKKLTRDDLDASGPTVTPSPG